MKHILLVEDEKILAKNIAFFLENEGYRVDIAYDGADGFEQWKHASYTLLLVDWSLPKMDGLELCRTIRQQSNVPIIMITARGELMDKVIGLEIGADDYIVKPFHQRELLARMNAVLRRNENRQSTADREADMPTYDGIVLDRDKMIVRHDEASTPLTANEYKLLDLMLKNPQRVFSREMLYDHVWGDHMGYHDRTVDVNVSRLRKKLHELSGKKYIHAVRGLGYRFGDDI